MGILLTHETLDRGRVVESVTTPLHGAVVTFEGIVRSRSRGQDVFKLEYEAYEPLAQVALERIAAVAADRWGILCSIAHRLGPVEAGECSVVVAVSSPHRGDAFEACRWLMESLKAEVPIWKKEYTDSGASWIEGSEAVPSGPRSKDPTEEMAPGRECVDSSE